MARPKSAAASVDLTLGRLVEDLTTRLHAGERIDWSAVIHDNPDYASELSAVRPSLEALAHLSHSSNAAVSGVAPTAVGDELIPGVLGDYRIVRELGRGGMGVVYEAEQISLNRRVALKVLPFAGAMDPRHLQRFRHEAQAAAMLHHPNIVPVHGVGCERTIHFYAMQYIDGQSLAAVIAELRGGSPSSSGEQPSAPGTISHVPSSVAGVCDPGRPASQRPATEKHAPAPDTTPAAALSTQKTRRDRGHYRRLAELIAQAADALEYAHTMGVVHRDIKPANLMLDAAGHLWVTDFGLAKFGTAAGLTMSGDLLGTLRYMSPEQALAKHGLVDHRTDVYGLGATLYELLTLQPAVDGADKQEMLRKIAFEEPTAPRQLDKAIPAELEIITLKCLAKNPNERYATAGELADDLRRWLGRQTIKARRPSLRQRLDKWVRRHAGVVVTAATALLLGTAVSTWQAVRAWQAQWLAVTERDRATEQEAIADAVTDFFQHDVLGHVDAAEQAKGGKPDPNLTVKEALDRAAAGIGDRFRDRPKIEGSIRNAIGRSYLILGDYRKAISHLERAVELALAEFGPESQAALAVTCNLAYAYHLSHRNEDAVNVLSRVYDKATSRLGHDHLDVINATRLLGLAYAGVGRAPEAIPLLERTLQQSKGRSDVGFAATIQMNLADAYSHAGRNAEAADLLRRLLDAETARLGPHHVHTFHAMSRLAHQYLLERRVPEATALYEKALEGFRATLGPDHPDTTGTMVTLAMIYTFDKPAAAIPLFEEAIPRMKVTPGPDHPDTLGAMQWLAQLYLQDRPADAAALHQEVLQRRRATLGPTHRETLLSLSQLGSALTEARKWDEAATLYQEWMEVLQSTLGPGHKDTLNAMRQYATAARNAGQPVDEVQMLEQTLAAVRLQSPADGAQVANTLLALAEVLDNAAEWEKGIPVAHEAVAGREKLLGPDHPDTLAALRRLEGLYRRAGRWAEDEAVLRELVKRSTAKLGPDHPDTLGARRDSAFLLFNTGRLAEAIAAYEQLRDVEQAKFGFGHRNTLGTPNNLATTYHFAGQLDDADRLAREHLELQQLYNGPESPAAGNALAVLGMNLLAQERYTDAEPVLRDAVRLYEQHPNPDWQRGRVRNLLGAALGGHGASDEAERLLVEGYEAMRREEAKIPAPQKRYLTGAGQQIVRYYETTNQPAKARAWRDKLPPEKLR